MISYFQENLENHSGKKFKFKLHNNRSTMLSVRWEPDCTNVSLHKMFLQAPKNVMEELACYLLRKKRQIAPTIKAFIDTNIKKMDFSYLVDQKNLVSGGRFYDLQQIYDQLNREYFDQSVNLAITWFGKSDQKNRSRVTFGLYHETMKLIKIHRMLDTPRFPDYVVQYVVFHEIVHHICPSYVDQKGVNRIHSKEFKDKEATFRHIVEAQRWIKDNQMSFFRNTR